MPGLEAKKGAGFEDSEPLQGSAGLALPFWERSAAAPRIGAITKSVHSPPYQRLLTLLRAARDEAGLSQRALAEKLDVPHSWVAKVELGERRLDVVEFVRVARALRRDPHRLLDEVVRAVRRSR